MEKVCMDKKIRKRVIIYSILFSALVTGITLLLLPFLRNLSDAGYQEELQQWINEIGIAGYFIILLVQILQVIIAFIPGEPIELLAGVLYGTIGGMITCLAGCILASTIIFTLSKKFGKGLLYSFFKEENIKKWKWLHDNRKSEMVIFTLFFIPGTPKDMLTYIVGITQMSTIKFIIISTIARIPSVLSSTMIGHTMREGQWKISLIVFVITGIAGILGIGFKDKGIMFLRKHSDTHK